MSGLRHLFKSEIKPLSSTGPTEFAEFIPLVGPGGGRVVVDKLIIKIVGTLTVGVAAFNGYDVPRLLSQVNVQEITGLNRWSLSGYKTKLMAEHLLGEDKWIDHPNIAVGAGGVVDLSLVVPFEKPFTVRPRDYSIGSDMFGKVILVGAAAALAQTGTTTLSALALQAYVLAEWHEEDSLEIKVQDQCQSMDFTTTNEARLVVGGPIHDLLLVKEGTTAGGDSIAAITDVRVDDLGIPMLQAGDFVVHHRLKRNIGNTGLAAAATERAYNLTAQKLILPIVAADEETSSYDGRTTRNVKINTYAAPAGCAALVRNIVPRDLGTVRRTLSNFNITENEALGARVKTASKSKRNPAAWSAEKKQFLPLSLPLPR